jgi:hypothetical protein
MEFRYHILRKRLVMSNGVINSRLYVGLMAGLVVLLMTALVLTGCSDMGSVVAGGDTSNLSPPPQQGQDISFQSHVLPIFQRYGCNSCHGGSGGLIVSSVAQLLRGGDNGPSVIPGKADSSTLVRKLAPGTPFGDRMPQGGPYLPDSTIQTIKLWINQGAKNN